jgi:hypothetical protein
MSAEEVLASLASLPAARPAAAAAPLLGAVRVADIEVAASSPAEEDLGVVCWMAVLSGVTERRRREAP